MSKQADTFVHLGFDGGFEDALRTTRRLMMAYLWTYPVLAGVYLAKRPPYSGAFLAWILIAVLGVLGLLTLTRFLIKIELVMDRERQQLLLRRRVLGFTQLVSLAGVEELWAVVTAGEVPAAPVNYWWDYVTLLITRSGRRFRAARHGDSFSAADQATRALGQQLGVEILKGKAGHKVAISTAGGSPHIKLREFHLQAADMVAVVFWAIMIFVTPVLTTLLMAT